MQSGVLRGRDHIDLGGIAAIAEGHTAVALSRGGAPKTYSHKDPNEDAAAFAHGDGGSLLAVADGHGGHEAAELALETLLATCAPDWTGPRAAPGPWPTLASGAVARVHAAILGSVARGGNAAARTTLTFALVRPREDRFAWASIGDSHVFRVDASRAIELGSPVEETVHFLGSPSRTPETLRMRSGSEALGKTLALVLVTDGLSERGIGVDAPAAAVAAATAHAAAVKPELRPLEAARQILERALEAHRLHRAGDNIATALHWTETKGTVLNRN
jgi:serine/threonine protein phosphatase PrpC